MKRRNRKYLQKMLCMILSLAMVMTGINLPQLGVQAAESDVAEDAAETGEDSGKDYIEGGDFTGLDWGDGTLGSWQLIESYWDVVSLKLNGWASRTNPQEVADDDTTSDRGLEVSFNKEKDGTFEIWQTISKELPAGTYRFEGYVKNATKAGVLFGESYSEAEEILELGDGDDREQDNESSDWMKVTKEFTLESAVSDYVVGIRVTESAGAWMYLDDVSLVCVTQGSEEDEQTPYIEGGDFVGLDWGDGKLGSWQLTESYWDVVSLKLNGWASRTNPQEVADDDTTSDRGLEISFNKEKDGTFEIW